MTVNLWMKSFSLYSSAHNYTESSKKFLYKEDADNKTISLKLAAFSQPFSYYKIIGINNEQVKLANKQYMSRKALMDSLSTLPKNILRKFEVKLFKEVNPYDQNAVAVVCINTPDNFKRFRNIHLGYIPAALSKLFRENFYRFKSGVIYNLVNEESPYAPVIMLSVIDKKNLESKRFRNILKN